MKRFLQGLLILLLLFNASSALFGGISLLLDSSGARLQMTPEMLQGSPFKNYFLPGILLILVNGLLPLVAAVGLLFGRPKMPLPFLPVFQNRHWAWSLALAAGLGLCIWIGVQIALIGFWIENPIQSIYGILGLSISALTLAPSVSKAYLLT